MIRVVCTQAFLETYVVVKNFTKSQRLDNSFTINLHSTHLCAHFGYFIHQTMKKAYNKGSVKKVLISNFSFRLQFWVKNVLFRAWFTFSTFFGCLLEIGIVICFCLLQISLVTILYYSSPIFSFRSSNKAWK